MSLRFRKSIKIMPGVRVNVSRSGLSTSIGVRGASINVKPGRKARVSVGIPGTGLSYSSTLSAGQDQAELPAPAPARARGASIGKGLGVGVAVLGGMFCFGSVTFGVIFIAAGAALFAACSRTEARPGSPN